MYASDDLRTWASGVGEAPRLAVTALLVSGPPSRCSAALGALRPVFGALGAPVPAQRSGLARRGTSACTASSLRQRTLILGSDTVASSSSTAAPPELGLDPVGFIDDDVHHPGELGIPRLGARLARI